MTVTFTSNTTFTTTHSTVWTVSTDSSVRAFNGTLVIDRVRPGQVAVQDPEDEFS